MKRGFGKVVALSCALFVIFAGCSKPTDPPVSQPEDPKVDIPEVIETPTDNKPVDETPVIDPDFEHPGNVELVSFEIPDIPEGVSSVFIYRKYNTDADFSYYGSFDFYTQKERTLTFRDDFVDAGKTYRYKYSYTKQDKEVVTVLVDNGETKNFTPSSGAGELKFVEPVPSSSYDPETTELSFKNKLEFASLPENYQKAMYISDHNSWLSSTVNFENTDFNLKEEFSHGRGRYNIDSFGPAVLAWSNWDYDNYVLWMLGKKYDVSDKDIKLYFPSGLEAENVENGIKVYATRPKFEAEWENSEIEIYENDVKLDCVFYIYNIWSIKERNSISFVYPFVTAGKKYTFKYSPYEGKTYEVSVTADKTSGLQIDKNKLKENFYGAKLSYTENDTESGPSRLVKLSKDAKDIFIGKTDSNLKFVEYVISMNTKDIEYTWLASVGESDEEYEALLTSGLDILDPSIPLEEWQSTSGIVEKANEGKVIYFSPYIQFSVDEKDSAYGTLTVMGEDSELFQWTEINESLFE